MSIALGVAFSTPFLSPQLQSAQMLWTIRVHVDSSALGYCDRVLFALDSNEIKPECFHPLRFTSVSPGFEGDLPEHVHIVRLRGVRIMTSGKPQDPLTNQAGALCS